jgi:hypothetical protein
VNLTKRRKEKASINKIRNGKGEIATKNKECYCILIKREIHLEDITIIKLYAPNVSAPNFIKHILMELKITAVMEDINTTVLPINRLFRQKNQQRNSITK